LSQKEIATKYVFTFRKEKNDLKRPAIWKRGEIKSKEWKEIIIASESN
jgi:hypothetical protein